MHEDLSKAAKALGAVIPNIAHAADQTRQDLEAFKSVVLHDLQQSNITNPNGADLVLVGSIARQETTRGSDCDYMVLQNGCLPHVSRKLLQIGNHARIEVGYGAPGQQGVFGDIVVAGSLYERIGLEADTNQNLTHRMLLLTESTSLLSSATNDTYNKTIENILTRYCSDYSPPQRQEDSPAKVPRYFVNDLIRFWRTMAVDFGAKRWRSSVDQSFFRLIKLRTSRKILFAGPLCSLLLVPNRTKVVKELPQYLRQWLSKPPLAQLASIASDERMLLSNPTKEALKSILEDYDKLLSFFDRSGVRTALQDPTKATPFFKQIAKECQEIADNIEENLERIFFDDPVFKYPFRKYSVF